MDNDMRVRRVLRARILPDEQRVHVPSIFPGRDLVKWIIDFPDNTVLSEILCEAVPYYTVIFTARTYVYWRKFVVGEVWEEDIKVLRDDYTGYLTEGETIQIARFGNVPRETK